MDAVDDFLGKDSGESNLCLYKLLELLITFMPSLTTACVCQLILILRFSFLYYPQKQRKAVDCDMRLIGG